MDRHMWAARRRFLMWVAFALAMIGALAGPGNLASAQDERTRERASVTFTELNDSGLSGTADLTARRERTEVSMQINGVVGDHPTHIHVGTCADLDPNPKYPLNNVELGTTELIGMSDTVVDVPLDELLASNHLILIHKSMEELDTYFACGDIVSASPAEAVARGTGGGATPEAGATADRPARALGNMGSGPMIEASSPGVPAALALAALALVAGALALRRRAFRG